MAALRRRLALPFWSWFWLLFAAIYFLLPLYSTLQFSLQTGTNSYGLAWYGTVLHDPEFRHSLVLSLRLAVETVALSLVLMVPTVYGIRLWLPAARPLIEFISVLPFVVPPIALTVGVIGLFQGIPWLISSTQLLALLYVVQALPFTYRSLDAGMSALDLHTLSDAGKSVGANWLRTLWHIILPNLRTAMLAASFLTIAIVLGEYTISSLLLFDTFAVYMQHIGKTEAYPSAALAILSFGFTWIAMLGLFVLTRGRGSRRAMATVK